MSAASVLIKRSSRALQWDPPITVVYIGLSSGPAWWPTLPERDEYEHSLNSGSRSMMLLCQNRGPAKDERKTPRIRPRVGGQRRRQPQHAAPGAGRLRAVFEDVGSGACWNRPGLNLPKVTLAPGGCVKIAAQDRLGRSRQKCWSWWAGCVRIRSILVSQLQVLAPGWTFSTGPSWRP